MGDFRHFFGAFTVLAVAFSVFAALAPEPAANAVRETATTPRTLALASAERHEIAFKHRALLLDQTARPAMPAHASATAPGADDRPVAKADLVLEDPPAKIWTSDDDGYTHEKSGAFCPRSFALPAPADLKRIVNFAKDGADVGCHYVREEPWAVITTYMSYWPDTSEEDHFYGAVRNMADALRITSDAPVVIAEADGESGAPAIEARAAGFLIADDPENPSKTAVWLVKVNGWHLKIRATFPANEPATELLIALHLNKMADEVLKAAPTA